MTVQDYGFCKQVRADRSKTDITLVKINDLTFYLETGKSYQFEAMLFFADDGGGGVQTDLGGGSVVASRCVYEWISHEIGTAVGGTVTRLGSLTAIGQLAASASGRHVMLRGCIDVSAAGTFIPRFAQLSANASPTVLRQSSYMKLMQVRNAPIVSSVAASTGSAAGGTNVTISGVGFTGATIVNFGGLSATAAAVVNDTTITCTTPAHAAGAVDVVVSGPNGTGTGKSVFTYT